jgi:acyl-CoA synthetase (NDP forming)
MKAGRTELARSVTISHTANVAGPEGHVNAWLRHHGVLRVDEPEAMARLTHMKRLVGDLHSRGLAVAGASGGGAAIAADLAEAHGVHLARFEPETMAILRRAIPSSGHVGNPMDLSGQSADPSMDTAAIYRAVLADPNVAALLYPYMVMLPDGGSKAGQFESLFDTLAAESERLGKPLIVTTYVTQPGNSWLDDRCDRFPLIGIASGIDRTMAALGQLSAHRRADGSVDGSRETPSDPASDSVITEVIGRRILDDLGVEVVPGSHCHDRAAALAVADALGYPVVVKAVVRELAHKAAGGAVVLGLRSSDDVGRAWDQLHQRFPTADGCLVERMVSGVELLVGLTRDADFGAIITLGLGSVLAETINVHGSVVVRAGDDLPVEDLLRAAGLERLAGRLPVEQATALGRTLGTLAASFTTGGAADLAFLEINPLFLTPDGRVLAADVLARRIPRL